MNFDDSFTIIDAEYQLGLVYLRGDGVQQNTELARKWLQRAAQKGHAEAVYALNNLPSSLITDFYPEGLVHKTSRGENVRSKSELIIADTLFHEQLEYAYEQPLIGWDGNTKYPDFTIYRYDGDIILWEHLGMLQLNDYKTKWEYKYQWYRQSGFIPGTNLFVSQDDNDGGINSQLIHHIAYKIQELVINSAANPAK